MLTTRFYLYSILYLQVDHELERLAEGVQFDNPGIDDDDLYTPVPLLVRQVTLALTLALTRTLALTLTPTLTLTLSGAPCACGRSRPAHRSAGGGRPQQVRAEARGLASCCGRRPAWEAAGPRAHHSEHGRISGPGPARPCLTNGRPGSHPPPPTRARRQQPCQGWTKAGAQRRLGSAASAQRKRRPHRRRGLRRGRKEE